MKNQNPDNVGRDSSQFNGLHRAEETYLVWIFPIHIFYIFFFALIYIYFDALVYFISDTALLFYFKCDILALTLSAICL